MTPSWYPTPPPVGAVVAVIGWDDGTRWESEPCTVTHSTPTRLTVEDSEGHQVRLTRRASGSFVRVHQPDAWNATRLRA